MRKKCAKVVHIVSYKMLNVNYLSDSQQKKQKNAQMSKTAGDKAGEKSQSTATFSIGVLTQSIVPYTKLVAG